LFICKHMCCIKIKINESQNDGFYWPWEFMTPWCRWARWGNRYLFIFGAFNMETNAVDIRLEHILWTSYTKLKYSLVLDRWIHGAASLLSKNTYFFIYSVILVDIFSHISHIPKPWLPYIYQPKCCCLCITQPFLL